MSLLKHVRSSLHKSSWTRNILTGLLVVLFILAIARAFLPLIIKLGAASWLEKQGMEISIGELEISLTNGFFAINDVSAKSETGQGFSFDRFAVDWQWQPLLNHQLVIEQIVMDSLKADAVFFANGVSSIAGFEINPVAEDQAEVIEPVAAAPWDVMVKNINFSASDFCLQQLSATGNVMLDYCVQLKRFDWTGDVSFKPSIQVAPDELPLYVQGTLHLDDMVVQNNQLELKLLAIASIAIADINIDTSANIDIAEIRMEKFSALQRSTQAVSAGGQIVAFEQLHIQPLKLTQLKRLQLGVIKLTDPSVYFLVNQDGVMEYQNWLVEKQDDVASQEKSIAADKTEPFYFAFDEFALTTSQHLTYVDNSLKEPFTVDVHDVVLSVTQIDSSAPDKPGHVSLAMSIDKHAALQLDADIAPLADRPDIKGSSKLSAFDMRILSPFTKQHIGHNIRSGQLDAELTINVDKGKINSNMNLALHQFNMVTLSKEEARELELEVGFPLNSSLSLLRDKNNRIHLEIPVTGDVNNPEFNPRDAIITASSKAITAAVIHYYTSFGLVFVAESLFDLATALNFEPVVFEAGESELKLSHQQQLDKLVTLMIERPGIHLTLCGISNKSDKDKLFPLQSDQQAEKKEGAESLSKEKLIVLKRLAESRSSNIKSYIIINKAVEAGRLIECAPEYLPAKISGVEISI